MYTLKVPRFFYDEHCDRDCVDGQYETQYGIVKATKKHYTVQLTEADALELLDDANHYSDYSWLQEDPAFLGTVASARATRKAVVLQLREQGLEHQQLKRYEHI